MRSGTVGLNLPIAGFIDAAEQAGDIELCPIFWCAAEPSAQVTDEAFEHFCGLLIAGLNAAWPLDGLYLDLHGAMITQSHFDGEGELLRRLRTRFGADLPIAISLDLHADITPEMVACADGIAIFRTYPHLDMAETGARCLPRLKHSLNGRRWHTEFRTIPYLIPLHAQCTDLAPCHELYEQASQASSTDAHVELALGFTAGDSPATGASILVQAIDPATASQLADAQLAAFMAAENAFECHLLCPDAAVAEAQRYAGSRPVVIADVQDNPGAGATSDTAGLLHALVQAKASNALMGLMYDPVAAGLAHHAGENAIIHCDLGGRSGLADDPPLSGDFRVKKLGDGVCRYTGAMYGGGTAILGPTAVLEVIAPETSIQIVVTSQRSQCLDLALFTHLGLEPRNARIIVVKSTVHFRADFAPIAGQIIPAAAPGRFVCDLQQIPFKHLRSGLRLGPRGPIYRAAAEQPSSHA